MNCLARYVASLTANLDPVPDIMRGTPESLPATLETCYRAEHRTRP
jgi:hypothetical protein